jgi:prepilin-type N-terminal cleavage/methylation domain-containing protein
MILKRNNKFNGFTLVELLVVIAIIGLLATLSIVALRGALIKARDVKRVADIKQIHTALEMYFNSNNSYPMTASYGENEDAVCHGGGWDCSNRDFNSDGEPFMTFLKTSGYMEVIPRDPINDSSHHFVYYSYTDTGLHNGCKGPYYLLIAYGMEGTPPASKILSCFTSGSFTALNSYVIMGGPNM